MSETPDQTAGDWETCHFRTRCQQRGVRRADSKALLALADRSTSVGGGCTSLTLSRDAAAALQAEGIAVADLDRVRHRAIVIGADGTPITVVIPSGQAGRRYRRGPISRRRARR